MLYLYELYVLTNNSEKHLAHKNWANERANQSTGAVPRRAELFISSKPESAFL